MPVLIKLIAQHGDGDDKRADDQVEDVAAYHGRFLLARPWPRPLTGTESAGTDITTAWRSALTGRANIAKAGCFGDVSA
jgi:hypothetical protein